MKYKEYVADVTVKAPAEITIESNSPIRPDLMKALIDYLTAEDMIGDENRDITWGFEVDRESMAFHGYNGQALEYTFEASVTFEETKKGDSLEEIEDEARSDFGCEFFHMVYDGIDVYCFPWRGSGQACVDIDEYDVNTYDY